MAVLNKANASDCDLCVAFCRTFLWMQIVHKCLLVVGEGVLLVSEMQGNVVCVVLAIA